MRIRFLDSLKGILILGIILSHTSLPQEIARTLFILTVPTFFFVSGFFLKKHLELKVSDFWKKKIKTLLMPYSLIGLISYVYWVSTNWFFTTENSVPFFKPLLGFFYGNGHEGWLAMNTPLWFFPCLFASEILLFYIYRFFRNTRALLVVVMTFSVIGVLNSLYPLLGFRLPFGLDMALYLILPLFLGSRMRLVPSDDPPFVSFAWALLFLATIPLLYGLGIWNGGVNINLNLLVGAFSPALWGWPLSIIPVLVFFPFLYVKIFQHLKLSATLEIGLAFIGKNSLYFFSLHTLAFGLSEVLQRSLAIDSYSPLLDLGVSLTSVSLFIFLKTKFFKPLKGQ